MFVLDTNVISELRKSLTGGSDPRVVAWIGTIPVMQLFISAISLMELEVGVLGAERRNPLQGAVLRHWIESDVKPSFNTRILPVDQHVALQCAALHVPNRKPERDALIAATALTHQMSVATRNTRDFAGTGVRLINPWEFSSPPER